jgi:flagellar biogenesis protein FliO
MEKEGSKKKFCKKAKWLAIFVFIAWLIKKIINTKPKDQEIK